MPTSPSFVISPPSPSPPRTHKHDHDPPLPHPSTRPDLDPRYLPLLRHRSHEDKDKTDATFIISKNKMQYQGQGQASGSGTGGRGGDASSSNTNNPRPLRAPAPGPLNLNYSTHQQNLSQSQLANYPFQNQNSAYGNPIQQGYIPSQPQYPISNTGRRMSGNEISPFQNTNPSLPSGSASSSPTNTFAFSNPPYINIDRSGRGEPMGSRPLPMVHLPGPQVPSEPRMGHYSNYSTYPQPQPQQYDQWQPQQGQEPIPSSSRRSTISNPSDHERINPSRPTTSEAPRVQDMAMVKTEPAQEEDDDEKMDHRKRKRNRTIRSCVPCHNHKRKVGQVLGCKAYYSVIGKDLVDDVPLLAW